MAAKYLAASHDHNGEYYWTDTLYGKPWPTDEIEALWHMIPGDFTIEWVAPTMCFVIKNMETPQRLGRFMMYANQTIPAAHAFDFGLWVRVFQSLLQERDLSIVSPRSLDLKE